MLATLATLFLSQKAPVRLYSNAEVGVQFEVPAAWTEVRDKKKQLTGYTLTAPSGSKATLNLFSLPFFADPTTWTGSQKQVSEAMKREVRQIWQEEILGVPMYMIRTAWTEDSPKMAIAGMFYIRSNKKLMFRLNGPEADFGEFFDQFKNALLTLQTADGKTPMPEEPYRKPTKEDAAPRPNPGRPLVLSQGPQSESKDQVETMDCSVSAHSALLSFPKGEFTLTKKEGGYEIKTKNGLEGTLTLFSTLDSEAPDVAYRKAWAETMNLFADVDSRKDGQGGDHKDSNYAWMYRVGKDTKGAKMVLLQGYHQEGEFYWLFKSNTFTEINEQLIKDLETLCQKVKVSAAK